jgi:hypothetical protein
VKPRKEWDDGLLADESLVDDDVETAMLIVERQELALMKHWKKALGDKLWSKAIEEEIRKWIEKKVFTLVDMKEVPVGTKVFTTLWTFTQKMIDHETMKIKARLCLNGSQEPDSKENFSAVVERSAIYTILLLAAKFGWKVVQADFASAFLNGERQTPIYARCGAISETKVLKITGNVYGSKSAPAVWQACLDKTLAKHGFKPIRTDRCVYNYVGKDNVKAMIACYVDDLIITGNNDEWIDAFVKTLSEECELTYGPVDKLLGMNVIREGERGPFRVTLRDFIIFKLKELGLLDNGSISTLKAPVTERAMASKKDGEEACDKTIYSQIVGVILYIALACRPDIAHVARVLTKHTKDPAMRHWMAAKSVMRYLAGTLDYGIVLGKPVAGMSPKGMPTSDDEVVVSSYSDANFATDESRRSTTGVLTLVDGSPVRWRSVGQSTVSTSTGESEYKSIFTAFRSAQIMMNIVKELKIKARKKIVIFNDNTAAVQNTEAVASGDAEAFWVASKDNLGDSLTKTLPGPAHTKASEALSLVPEVARDR